MTPGDPAPPLVTPLVPPPDPLETCARLADLPHRAWLDSSQRDHPTARFSFLSADPWSVVSGDVPSPIAAVRTALAAAPAHPLPGLPPFQGGAIGYLAYEFARHLERLPHPHADDLAVPDAWFGLYDWVIAWDHTVDQAWLVSTGLPERAARAARRAADRTAMVLARLTHHGAAPHRAPGIPVRSASSAAVPIAPVPALASSVHSVLSPRDYRRAVQRIRDHIAAGDVYQVNLTQRLTARIPDDPVAFYARLRRHNPAPFAAYLEPGPWAIASASPERFLRVDTHGAVETRPIKGTRPRGAAAAADRALAGELLASEKDRAENVMIVDLLRNDLSRVCEPGSVAVPELCRLERFATVQHLVSTVTGRLARGHNAFDLLCAAFPGGSITGAPKIRAMEIIAAIEPVARGVYCGTIGYWSVTGACDTSIAIRTCTVRDGWGYFGVGGGITADSDPDQEYAESLDKARGIVGAITPS